MFAQLTPIFLGRANKLKSPIRYPGGKSRHIKHLAPLLPKEKIREYREPFCGGASMFFYLKSIGFADQYWINDKFELLANFWKQLQNTPASYEIMDRLYRIKNECTVEHVRLIAGYFKEELSFKQLCSFLSPLEQATYFFLINRCSFSGSTLSGGLSKKCERFTKSSIDKLSGANRILQGVKITNLDYMEMFDAKYGNFYFLDPPYTNGKKLYGNSGDLQEFNHRELAAVLDEIDHRWMLTYDNSPLIKELYKDYNIHEISITSSMNNCSKEKKQKRVTELVITNYET